ncbi:uncharacterized protein V1518DRAFT_451131 [Limtongia smithiae]|uniref:uncharacterized protein n=1 Tax=Limtongia smithiae TaxID=1125753 RepID=UPI0034CDB3EC
MTSGASIRDTINKATDENLTSENWDLIMTACDLVNASPEATAKEAVDTLAKRLSFRSGNVQLYALTLANALAQNGDMKTQRELASSMFTNALVRLGSDRTAHPTVKTKLLEVVQEMTTAFGSDPQLALMAAALNTIKASNPSLAARVTEPARPSVQRAETSDEDDIKKAIALSLQDVPAARAEPPQQQHPQQQPQQKPVPEQAQNMVVHRVRAQYDYETEEANTLSFKKGDIIWVLDGEYSDWWKGSLRGQIGLFPLNYVEPMTSPSNEELAAEAAEETEVFAAVGDVSRLVQLVTMPSEENRAEMRTLYEKAISLQPKLVRVLTRYAERKNEFEDLNARFKEAMDKYNEIFVSSLPGAGMIGGMGGMLPGMMMSHTPVPSATPMQMPPLQASHNPFNTAYTDPYQMQQQPQQPLEPMYAPPQYAPPAMQQTQQQQQQQQQHQGMMFSAPPSAASASAPTPAPSAVVPATVPPYFQTSDPYAAVPSTPGPSMPPAVAPQYSAYAGTPAPGQQPRYY